MSFPLHRISLSKNVEFIQAITVDINGIARGKVYPIEKLSDLLDGKEEVVGLLEVLGTKSEIPQTISELTKNHYENQLLVPDPTSVRECPWSDDSSLAMFFYDTHDRVDNLPWPFNPRLAAKTQINKLEKMGFQLFIGVENEFRLFDKETKRPFTQEICFDHQITQFTTALPYMKLLDIEMDSWHLEYGRGQIEVPLKVYSGIEGVDNVWFFKELSKYVANDFGMIASYMSVPLAGEAGNGLHINHSLWTKTTEGYSNAMWAKSDKDEMSEVAHQWLAGLLKHSKALCAFYSPTVNCYRRIHMANWAPNTNSWNYRDRTVAFRVKASSSQEKVNYIENRLPSSACNIYLAIAGMIVAGIDGIKNKLNLPDPGNNSHCEDLPRSLSEALDELSKDQVLINGLGEKCIDWFIKAKLETDVHVLSNVDLISQTEDALQQEFDKYFCL